MTAAKKDDETLDTSELPRRILADLKHAGATALEAHAAIVRVTMHSMDRMLSDAAAVGSLQEVRAWLGTQLEALDFYRNAWRPGGAANESSSDDHAGNRVH